MVRTKADAATRVAAGAKAPKKMVHRVIHSPSPSPTGKDNFPVNRYCPRETPSWQKKITCFYQKNFEDDSSDKEETPEENVDTTDTNRKPKRTSAELELNDDETAVTPSKRFKSNDKMEVDSE